MKIELTAGQMETIRQALRLVEVVNSLSSLTKKHEIGPLIEQFDQLLGDPLKMLTKAEAVKELEKFCNGDRKKIEYGLGLLEKSIPTPPAYRH